MRFVQHQSGLHFWKPEPQNTGVALVETVAGNKSNYTKRQLKGAEKARELYAAVGYPSSRDFRYAVQMKQIADCPITTEDIDVAQAVWGKSIAALKGKTTRRKPKPVVSSLIQVPRELLKLHRKVFLAIDIFFVNGIAFFASISRKLCYTATLHLNLAGNSGSTIPARSLGWPRNPECSRNSPGIPGEFRGTYNRY
jgi:hypothetical protein